MLAADKVASVLVSRTSSGIDAMALQMLLYYVQAWHLAITDEPLFEDSIEAWPSGPVIPQVRRARTDGAPLSEVTSDLIDLVLLTYGSMSSDALSALSRSETPWREARGDLPPGAPRSTSISTDAMAAFYRSHRRLGGRTAADLAAGGVHVASPTARGPVEVDRILESLDEALFDPGIDPWGGANLEAALRPDPKTKLRQESGGTSPARSLSSGIEACST